MAQYLCGLRIIQRAFQVQSLTLGSCNIFSYLVFVHSEILSQAIVCLFCNQLINSCLKLIRREDTECVPKLIVRKLCGIAQQ